MDRSSSGEGHFSKHKATENANNRIERDFGLAAPLRSAANPKRFIRGVRQTQMITGRTRSTPRPRWLAQTGLLLVAQQVCVVLLSRAVHMPSWSLLATSFASFVGLLLFLIWASRSEYPTAVRVLLFLALATPTALLFLVNRAEIHRRAWEQDSQNKHVEQPGGG